MMKATYNAPACHVFRMQEQTELMAGSLKLTRKDPPGGRVHLDAKENGFPEDNEPVVIVGYNPWEE